MARFVKGSIVVVPFPFSDLSDSKRRPALVLADLNTDDIILCQITSRQSPNDRYAVAVSNINLQNGSLISEGNIRPNKIFTADKALIIRTVGILDTETYQAVFDKIVELIEP